MIKYILTFLLIFQAGLSNANEYDKKILDVLYRELRAATKLLQKKKSSRNYYRVYNSRVEILKIKSKQIRKLQFVKKDHREVKKLQGLNYKFYKRTKLLGDQLAKRYKKFANMGKFFLMQGLLTFEYEENSPDIPVYLLKAVKYLKDKGLKNHAAGKLGDYYFNQRSFKKAIKYYKYALRIQRNSPWSDRYYYNMAWSYFKLDQFKKAVASLMAIFKSSSKKSKENYHYVQAIKKIPEFYVFAGEPDKGFNFVRKVQVNDGRALFEYIKYVYSKGFFQKFDIYVSKIENYLEKKNKQKSLLSFRVEMYNFLVKSEFKKSRLTMLKLRKEILGYYSKGSLNASSKKEFYQINLELLAENFKRINQKDFSKRDKYFKPIINDTLNLLETMMVIDPRKKSSYEMRYAQVLRRGGKNDEALRRFEALYSKQKNKNSKVSIRLLEEIITIYSLKEQTVKNPKKEMEYYVQYLRYGKDKEAKRLIYLKLYDMYYNDKNYKQAYSLTQTYYKRYPKEHKQVELMLLKLATAAQAENDEKFIKDIKAYIAKNPELKKSKQLSDATSATYQNLVLGRINNLLNSDASDKKQVASKLVNIYNDKEIDRVNRLISGFNAGLLFSQIGAFGEASKVLTSIVDESLPNEFSNYGGKISVIAREGMSVNPQNSLVLMSSVYTKSCKIRSLNRNRIFIQYFEALLFNSKYKELVSLSQTFRNCKIAESMKEKAVSLVYEYSNFGDNKVVASSLAFLNARIINDAAELNSYFQDYITFKMNSFQALRKTAFREVLNEINQTIAMAGNPNLEVYIDFKNILNSGMNNLAFQKMNLDENTIESFLEKNLSLFAESASTLSQYKTKFQFISNLKDVVQVTIFEDLFSFMESFPSMVQDQTKVEMIQGFLEQALEPFRTKYKELVSAMEFKSSESFLRYSSLRTPRAFYSWDTRYFTVDQ